MLTALNVDQARFVALLAKAARTQRDELLGNVAEADLSPIKAARGEHNPTAELGFEPLRTRASQPRHCAKPSQLCPTRAVANCTP